MPKKTALYLAGRKNRVSAAILERLGAQKYQCFSNLPEPVLDASNEKLEGDPIRHKDMDLTDRESLIEGVSDIISDYGTLELLVVHVQDQMSKSLAEITPDDWNQVLSSNVLGPFFALQEVAPHMKGESEGRIINIIGGTPGASDDALGLLNETAASALETMTRQAARSLRPEVAINTILLGKVRAPTKGDTTIRTREGLNSPFGKPLHPQDAADAVWYLSHRTRTVSGKTIDLRPGTND